MYVGCHHANQFLCIFADTNQVQSTHLTPNNKMVYLDLQLLVSRNIDIDSEVCVCTYVLIDVQSIVTNLQQNVFEKFSGLMSLGD